MSSSPGTRRTSDVFTSSERPSKRLCDGFPSTFQCDLPSLLQRSLFGPASPSRPPSRSIFQLQFDGKRLPNVGESRQSRHKSGTKRQVRHQESSEALGVFSYTTSSASQQPCSTPFWRRQSGDFTPHVASSHSNIPQWAHNNISDRIGHPCSCLATYTGDAVCDVATGLTASHTSLVAVPYKHDGDHDIIYSVSSPRSSGHSTNSTPTMAFSYDTTIDPSCINAATSPTTSNGPFEHIFTFKWNLPDRNMNCSPSERSDSDMSGSFSDSAHSTPYLGNNRSLPHGPPSFDLLSVSSPMAIADAAFREAIRFGTGEHGDEKLQELQLSPFSFPELDDSDIMDVSDWPYHEAGSNATALHVDSHLDSRPSPHHSLDSSASCSNFFPPQHINPAALTLIGPGIFPSYSDSSQDIWQPRLTNQNDVQSCPSSASSSSEYFDFDFQSDPGSSFPRSGLPEPPSTFDSPLSSARRASGHLFHSPTLPLPLAPHGLGLEPNCPLQQLSTPSLSYLDSQPSPSFVQIQKVPLRHPQPVRPIPLIRIPASTWEQESAPVSSTRDSRSDL